MGRTSREIQLVEYPQGDVQASHFRILAAQVPEPGPGEVLVRNTFTSVDPGMRLRLRANAPAGYFQSFPLRAPMDGIMTVGEVVECAARSRNTRAPIHKPDPATSSRPSRTT